MSLAARKTGRGSPPKATVAAPATTTPSGSTARNSARTVLVTRPSSSRGTRRSDRQHHQAYLASPAGQRGGADRARQAARGAGGAARIHALGSTPRSDQPIEILVSMRWTSVTLSSRRVVVSSACGTTRWTPGGDRGAISSLRPDVPGGLAGWHALVRARVTWTPVTQAAMLDETAGRTQPGGWPVTRHAAARRGDGSAEAGAR